ncbi:hypothetical protein [Halalkalicoccus jeotgali]|uniref:Conditioned medium-induced protein 4 n=1 Tax=Halalkalicoccus jeotgali (strain DSM 18796 / CECT 7217 / JCM 14584 / KCTC 4019 / B3) TaxID=795797 RepID=D8J4B6_HALJB|nr:hypothetical protein [Halalkalicoccus jeotgali]ADJ13478.1 hypothetical protein HacjB3_00425 [Halalkalicoccus jeotgali B3]ELY33047.1 hypothetical protein C497_18907 [Halalkalicoccus jeotgali B3]
MDEKTEELRDLFLDVSEDGTVTETQEETPGSLTDEQPEDERLDDVIGRMEERYAFETDWDHGSYRRLVRGFFEEDSDAELAEELDVDEASVVRARMDLHLLRESDTDFPFELRELRRLRTKETDAEPAEELDADEATLDRAICVIETQDEARTANDRFRDEFEEIVTDGDLSTQLARDAREDGLEEATEGMENDLSM